MDFPRKLNPHAQDFRLSFGTTRIDHDPANELANRKKHGYSLESAVRLLTKILLPSGTAHQHLFSEVEHYGGEVRHQHLCVDDAGHVVFMVTTMRPDETVRVMSLRRADVDERDSFSRLTGYTEPDQEH